MAEGMEPKPTPPKRWQDMTTDELREATQDFNRLHVAAELPYLPKAEEAEIRRRAVKRPRGRPKVGRGVKRVSLSLEQGILAEIDAAAAKAGLGRAAWLTAAARESLIKSSSKAAT